MRKGQIASEETKRKLSESHKGQIAWNKGKHLSKEHKEKLSESHKGHKLLEETKRKLSIISKGIPRSKEVKEKISKSERGKLVSEKTRRNISKNHANFCGELNPNWKGGIAYLPYCSKFNKKLKERIRERDNRTCQLCYTKENGKKLSVHHIHYDKENCYPDLIALCCRCNTKVNRSREHYEKLFMRILEYKELLNYFGNGGNIK